jgi:mannosyltransferase
MAADTATDAVATPDPGTPASPGQTPEKGQLPKRADPPEQAGPSEQGGPSERDGRAGVRGLLPALRLVVAPFVLTLGVMLVGIGDRQLWRDENATWWAASLSLGELRKLVEGVDVVLLPYYVLMHGWIAVFGDSATALRVPSALFMAVAAALVALVGRRLFDAPAGLVAGLLVPFVPVVSRYGQEARPYAMAMVASVAAVLLLLRAIEKPTVWRWLGYTLAVIWVACSHIVALMALAAHLIAVLAALRARPEQSLPPGPDAAERARRRRILFGWPVAVVLAVLAVSPLVVIGRRQGGQINWIPDPTWARVQEFPGEVFMSGPVAGFFLALGLAALAGLAFAARGARWPAGFLAVWALLPPVLAYYTFDAFSFFYPRYLLFTVPAWVLLAAYGLRSLAGAVPGEGGARRAWAAVTAVTVAAAAGLTFAGWDEQEAVRSNRVENEVSFRAAAAYIRAHEQPGDGIIFTGYPYTHRGFRYEWRDQPRAEQPREILVDLPAGRSWSWVHPRCADTVACLGSTKRIWLVSTDPSGLPLSPLPPTQQPEVEARYDVVLRTVFHRMWVTELVRKPAKSKS